MVLPMELALAISLLLGTLTLYWIIRLAVRHGVNDQQRPACMPDVPAVAPEAPADPIHEITQPLDLSRFEGLASFPPIPPAQEPAPAPSPPKPVLRDTTADGTWKRFRKMADNPRLTRRH